MGEIMKKALQVNPIKLSQPMGATLAFLGIKGAMPLMHGAQGCASFTKVLFTRHFCEPIAIQTTAVNDITAVIDGGDSTISEAIDNITKKSKVDLVGLFSTGLTETKGDDIKNISKSIDYPIVYVNTPDYEGDLESGWARAVESIISQMVKSKDEIDSGKALILPNANLEAIEVENLKDFISSFGFNTLSLPDISTSLDGFLGEKQGVVSSGGIELSTIKELANSSLVVTVGESMRSLGDLLKGKNPKIFHIHLDSLIGLSSSDNLVEQLLSIRDIEPDERVKRWRARLQDAMLDTHFPIGKTRFAIAGDSDRVYAISKALNEVGANIEVVISSSNSNLLQKIEAKEVLVGDLEDIENRVDRFDCLISNTHAERIARKYHKALVVRGFPNYEEVGNQLKSDILYQGSCYFLFEVVNAIKRLHREVL